MNILFLSRWFPDPPNNGSKLRILYLLKALAAKHRVTLLSFADESAHVERSATLTALCDAVYSVPWRPYQHNSQRARWGFLSPTPRFLIDTFSPQMCDAIQAQLASGRYDLVIASQIDMAAYQPHFGSTPALYEEAEVGVLYENFVRAESLGRRLRCGLTWWKHKHYLNNLAADFASCTVVSQEESDLLHTIVDVTTPVHLVPNCLDLRDYPFQTEAPQPNTLIFTGAMSYFPNLEGMRWFLNDVYGQIQEELPAVTLTMTGKRTSDELPTAAGVTRTGLVPDVRPLVTGAWVSVAPIWRGGGTRLKILEAMALGTPVVSTSKGVEGIGATPGQHLLVADSSQEFARATVSLLRDRTLRKKIVEHARKFVEQRYSLAAVAPHFLQIVEDAAAPVLASKRNTTKRPAAVKPTL